MLVEIGYNEFCERVNDSACGEFSHEALDCLFQYLEEFQDYKLDVVALHCDWSELTLGEFITEFDAEFVDNYTIKSILDDINYYPLDLDGAYLSLNGLFSYCVLLPNGNVLFCY